MATLRRDSIGHYGLTALSPATFVTRVPKILLFLLRLLQTMSPVRAVSPTDTTTSAQASRLCSSSLEARFATLANFLKLHVGPAEPCGPRT